MGHRIYIHGRGQVYLWPLFPRLVAPNLETFQQRFLCNLTQWANTCPEITVKILKQERHCSSDYIWDKVFKSGLSKFFKDCLPQNLHSPLLNNLSHLWLLAGIDSLTRGKHVWWRFSWKFFKGVKRALLFGTKYSRVDLVNFEEAPFSLYLQKTVSSNLNCWLIGHIC